MLVKFGSTAGVEEGCGGCVGGDWRRYSSRMSLATSLQGVVWLWLSFSASSPSSIRAGLSLASALVPDLSLTPGGLPVLGLVLQCLSSSRRSVEPAALFTRKHVVRTWEDANVNTTDDPIESTWNLDSPTCGGVYVQLRGYVGWRNTGSVTQCDDCCAELSVQFGAFCHLKGQAVCRTLLLRKGNARPERWHESESKDLRVRVLSIGKSVRTKGQLSLAVEALPCKTTNACNLT